MASTTIDFTLLPVTHDDIPRICEIGKAAFANDKQTVMKMHEQETTDVGSQLPPESEIRGQVDAVEKGKCVFLKAVDVKSGRIAGYATWGLWHYDGSKPAVSTSSPL
jgi:hypothetical protein